MADSHLFQKRPTDPLMLRIEGQFVAIRSIKEILSAVLKPARGPEGAPDTNRGFHFVRPKKVFATKKCFFNFVLMLLQNAAGGYDVWVLV